MTFHVLTSRSCGTSPQGRPPAGGLRPLLWLLVCVLSSLPACSTTPSGTPNWTVPGQDGGVNLGDGVTATADGGDTATGGDTGGDGATAGDGAAIDSSDAGVGPTGPGCAKATACKPYPEAPYCDMEYQVCVECLLDFHCASTTGHCENYKCLDLSCVPGHVECQGNFLSTCKSTGDGYDQVACPDNKPFCAVGKCLACKAGEVECAPPGAPGASSIAVQKCNASGTAADIVELCKAGETCFAGVCGVCTPGSKRCTNHLSEQCSGDGNAWQIVQDCSQQGLTCLGGLCVSPCADDFKSNTNVGCDYWAVDLDNAVDSNGGQIYDAQNAQFSLIVSNTSTAEASVTVTLGPDKTAPGAKTKTWKVPAKGLQVIDLPDKSWKIANQNQDGTTKNKMAYRVQSTQPIVAYQFNPLQNYGVFSNDASLLLPTGSLGEEYWVVSRNQLGEKFRSYFTVIATLPGDTEVTVVVSAPTAAGVGVPSMTIAGKQTFTLAQGEVLNVESNKAEADLTGSWVKANRPVAVFGGSEASNSPQIGNCVPKPSGFPAKVCAGSSNQNGIGTACNVDTDCPSACCADHLEEQLFPVKSWGTSYVGARLSPRGKELDAWRVMASENGTKVTIVPNIGITVPTLNQGQFYEFQTIADFVLTSDKPVLLAQYMASSYATITKENPTCTSDASCKSQHGFLAVCEKTGFGSGICSPIGDPSLILDVATTQYLDDYVFLVPDKYKFNFITVIAPQGASVTLDGTALLTSGFQTVQTTTWTVARLPIGAGKHALTSNKKVGLFVYGYDDDVSYGYPGGAGL